MAAEFRLLEDDLDVQSRERIDAQSIIAADSDNVERRVPVDTSVLSTPESTEITTASKHAGDTESILCLLPVDDPESPHLDPAYGGYYLNADRANERAYSHADRIRDTPFFQGTDVGLSPL